MKIEVENSIEDYKYFYKYFFFKRDISKRIIAIISFSIVLSLFNWGGQFSYAFYLIRFIIIIIILFILFFLIPYFRGINKFSKKIYSGQFKAKKISFEIISDGLRIISGEDDDLYAMNEIKYSGLLDKYIYIVLRNKKQYLIPLRFFKTKQEENLFSIWIRNSGRQK